VGISARHADLDVAPGDSVTIVDGAFSGLVGKITEVDNEKMKLKVNIDMFGRETSTELNFDQVYPILK
jgi:transcriptional antiterminator NusG